MAPKDANKILVVDDDSDILDFLIELLQDEISVSFASDGPKALELAKLHNPDLILLDVMMPGMDGFEVCRRLKTDPDVKHIPVVFLTAKTDIKDVHEGLELGAVDYITKPFDPEIVVTKVQNLLKQITAIRTATALKEGEQAVPASAAAPEPVADRRALGTAREDRYPKNGETGKGMSLTQFLVVALLLAGAAGAGYAWYSNTADEKATAASVPTTNTAARTAPAEPAPSVDPPQQGSQVVSPETSSPTPTAPQTGTSSLPLSSAPSTDTCGDIPKVPWWGNASHGSIIAYVNNRNDGDWNAYIAKWERQLAKLQGIHSKGGTVIAPKLGTRLKGPTLGKYITQVSDRVAATRCLARILSSQ